MFGGFSFVGSDMDVTPPEWFYVSIGSITIGNDIEVAIKEAGKVYLVPSGTLQDTALIYAAAVGETELSAYTIGYISTVGLQEGVYMVYAVDAVGNVSEPSKAITLEKEDGNGGNTRVNGPYTSPADGISIEFYPDDSLLKLSSRNGLHKILVYDILGNLLVSEELHGIERSWSVSGFKDGVYLIRVIDNSGNALTKRFLRNS
jgi:hypothetical protein